MVECGEFSDPPKNLTIWSIIELCAFLVYAGLSIGGMFLFINNFKDAVVSGIVHFVSDGCFVVAMAMIIFGFCSNSGARLRIGLYALVLAFLCDLAVILFGIIFGFKKMHTLTIFKAIFGGFLSFMVYKQYKKVDEGGDSGTSAPS